MGDQPAPRSLRQCGLCDRHETEDEDPKLWVRRRCGFWTVPTCPQCIIRLGEHERYPETLGLVVLRST